MNEITPIKNVNMNPNFIKKNRPDSTSIEQSTISDTIKTWMTRQELRRTELSEKMVR